MQWSAGTVPCPPDAPGTVGYVLVTSGRLGVVIRIFSPVLFAGRHAGTLKVLSLFALPRYAMTVPPGAGTSPQRPLRQESTR